jgi:hypothetical protein
MGREVCVDFPCLTLHNTLPTGQTSKTVSPSFHGRLSAHPPVGILPSFKTMGLIPPLKPQENTKHSVGVILNII